MVLFLRYEIGLIILKDFYFIFSILRHCVRIDSGATQFNFKCLRGALPTKVNSAGAES
jgi:hypothetical protein